MDNDIMSKKRIRLLMYTVFAALWLILTGLCVYMSLNAGSMRIEAYGIVLLSFSIVPFLLIGALYGYFISMISYTVAFIASLIYNMNNAYMMSIFLVPVICFSGFSQYYFFQTKKKTLVAASITLVLNSIIEVLCISASFFLYQST